MFCNPFCLVPFRSDKQYAYNPVLSRTPAAAAAAAVNGGLNGTSVASPQSPSEPAKIRRENVMTELLTTEGRYVQDLEEVLLNYRDKLAVSNLTETRVRAEALFGNLDEIHAFHARSDHQFIMSPLSMHSNLTFIIPKADPCCYLDKIVKK